MAKDPEKVTGFNQIEIDENGLWVNGTQVDLNAAELNALDGVVAGTAAASKALVLGTTKQATGLGSLALAGTVSGGIKIAPIATGTAEATLQNQNVAASVITLPSATTTLPGLSLDNTFTGAVTLNNIVLPVSGGAPTSGTATVNGTTGVTIATTLASVNSHVLLTYVTPKAGVTGILSYTVSAGVSITINSTDAADTTSTVNWLLVN